VNCFYSNSLPPKNCLEKSRMWMNLFFQILYKPSLETFWSRTKFFYEQKCSSKSINPKFASFDSTSSRAGVVNIFGSRAVLRKTWAHRATPYKQNIHDSYINFCCQLYKNYLSGRAWSLGGPYFAHRCSKGTVIR